MTTESTVAEAHIERHRFTRADFHSMAEAGILGSDERVELIEGEIVDRAPIGNRHVRAVDVLTAALTSAVGNRGIVSIQGPIVLSEFSEPEPDVGVYRYREDFYRDRDRGPEDVLLLVEVADSSLRYDTEVKLPLYARHRVPEVWLVDLVAERLVRYRDPSPQGYRASDVVADLTVVPVPGLAAVVDLSRVF